MLVLDMKTLCLLVSFYSFTFGVGLLFFYFEQRKFKGIKFVAVSMIVIAIGIGLLAIRGSIPSWLSIILANMLICSGMSILLYGLCLYRESSSFLYRLSFSSLLILFVALIYFYYIEYSINNRAISVSVHVAFTQLLACVAIFEGKAKDNTLPKIGMILVFFFSSITMLVRVVLVFHDRELDHYLLGGWVHQTPYFAYMFLAMATSFNLIWLVNGRLTGSIKEMAIKDNLTSLYNRRGMDKVLSEMSLSKTGDYKNLVALMCDIDHFKSINDNFGHILGDEVIVSVSRQIRQQIRSSDIAIRYGGEEFLILLPNISLKDATIIAERVRKAVLEIPLTNDIPSTSISIGVSELEQGEDLKSLISRSDIALYDAKKKGRNRVVVARQNFT
ncbi:GGDEF domain-containing protein [Vibrio owensii]|uniref:GGDEF domain-containing protein n=1 Tax=Vibrio owensii TaxID=696485 RepID=UPI000597AD29|nr:GGDEF domain-containing protein [Vibrio owensii]